MIEQGFVLMGAGMGVVGLFLIIMVAVMHGSSAILRRFDKESDDERKKGPGEKAGGNGAELAVAIAAARSRMQG